MRGTTDERGTLFEEYVRLLKQLKPTGFLFENVYGITGADDGKAWQSICAAFDQSFFKEQRELINRVYNAVRHLRLIFANHPNVIGYEVDELLFKGQIRDY